ncbi:MAG: hypothetical protein IEMM0007_0464 [bacterium]|nr:MAG: hypothetical protein IEMM0007_0464 [bacterium]
MKYDSKIHKRKSIQLKNYDYSQAGLYFITICSQNRECFFGNIENGEMSLNDAGHMVSNQRLDLPKRFEHIELCEYVVMPNHFHGIIHRRGEPCVRPDNSCVRPDNSRQHQKMANTCTTEHKGEHKVRPYPIPNGTSDGSIGRIIQAFKSFTTNEYIRGVKQNNWRRFDKKLWQRNYYEHVIRDNESYRHISEYIQNNPLKWREDKYYG